MEHSLKPFLPKLLLITPLVALQSLNAQSVNNPYATYYTVLSNPLYLPNHPNLSLLSTIPLLNSSQSVPLTEIEIKPVIKQPVIPLADARFNQWGEAGLILRGRYPEKILPPSPEFSMVFPLFQEVDRFLLTQLSARHNDLYGKQTAYSLGFGQRFWPLNQLHWWGTHLFYDHCSQGKHHRLGLVGEWQNNRARCTVNGYFPLSQWRLDEQNQLEKRPARSLDFRLQWFLFQKPCVNLNVLIEHAFSHSLSYPNQSAAAPHPTALTLGLNYTPVSLITIGYDAKMAHKEKPSHQLQIQFTYRLGIPLAQQFNPALATTGYDPATNRLSLIHRQSTVLLEKREISPLATLVPITSAEETEKKPSENTLQAKEQSPRALGQSISDNHLDKQPYSSITDEKDFAKALNMPDQEVNTGQRKLNNSADKSDHSRASLFNNTPKPMLYPEPPQLNVLEEREASCEQKAVSPGNQYSLDSTQSAGWALDTTTQSGIRPHSQTTEGNWDQVSSQETSASWLNLGDHERPMRNRRPPDRLSHSAGPTKQKTKTTHTGTKHPKASKTKDQPPQGSDSLTTQTSLGDEEHVEQQQKSTPLVCGLPESPNIPPSESSSLLYNHGYSNFSDSENKAPSNQILEVDGEQPSPSTAQLTKQTAQSQKLNKPLAPTSNQPNTRRQSQR